MRLRFSSQNDMQNFKIKCFSIHTKKKKILQRPHPHHECRCWLQDGLMQPWPSLMVTTHPWSLVQSLRHPWVHAWGSPLAVISTAVRRAQESPLAQVSVPVRVQECLRPWLLSPALLSPAAEPQLLLELVSHPQPELSTLLTELHGLPGAPCPAAGAMLLISKQIGVTGKAWLDTWNKAVFQADKMPWPCHHSALLQNGSHRKRPGARRKLEPQTPDSQPCTQASWPKPVIFTINFSNRASSIKGILMPIGTKGSSTEASSPC